jgi:hypothetical protein
MAWPAMVEKVGIRAMVRMSRNGGKTKDHFRVRAVGLLCGAQEAGGSSVQADFSTVTEAATTHADPIKAKLIAFSAQLT